MKSTVKVAVAALTKAREEEKTKKHELVQMLGTWSSETLPGALHSKDLLKSATSRHCEWIAFPHPHCQALATSCSPKAACARVPLEGVDKLAKDWETRHLAIKAAPAQPKGAAVSPRPCSLGACVCEGVNKRIFQAMKRWMRDLDQVALGEGQLVIRWDFYLTAEDVEPSDLTPGVGLHIKSAFTHVAHHFFRPVHSTLVFVGVCDEYANVQVQDDVPVESEAVFVKPHLQGQSEEPNVSLPQWVTSLDARCAVEATCGHLSTRATVMAVMAGHARVFMKKATRQRIWAGSLVDKPRRKRGKKPAHEVLDSKPGRARESTPSRPPCPEPQVASESTQAVSAIDVLGDNVSAASDKDADGESSSGSDVIVELVGAASSVALACQPHAPKSVKTSQPSTASKPLSDSSSDSSTSSSSSSSNEGSVADENATTTQPQRTEGSAQPSEDAGERDTLGRSWQIHTDTIGNWHTFRLTWRPPPSQPAAKRTQMYGSWQATCSYHKRCTGSACKKTVRVLDATPQAREHALSCVKAWCLAAVHCRRQREHVRHDVLRSAQYDADDLARQAATMVEQQPPPPVIPRDDVLDAQENEHAQPKAKAKTKRRRPPG